MKTKLLFSALFAVSLLGAADPTTGLGFLVGTTAHYAFLELPIEESLSIMQQGGHNSWRSDIKWWAWLNRERKLTPQPGIIQALDATQKYHFEPILTANNSVPEIGMRFPYGPYAEPYIQLCEFSARHIRGKARLFQVWNEWDGGHEMKVGKGVDNSPENYVELLKRVYPRIKKANPEAIVVANSVCTGEKFLYRTFELGVQQHCDAYSIHIYDLKGTPEEVYERVKKIEATSAKYNHGIPKPFYFTEISWYTSMYSVSEERQADYLARLYLLIRTLPSCRGLYWYNFNDRGDDYRKPNRFWGITMRDMTPKESFYALKSVSEVVRNGKFVRRIAVKDPHIYLLLYKMNDGRNVLAAWTTEPETRLHVVLDKNGQPGGELLFERCGNPAIKRNWGFRDRCGKHGNKPNDPQKFSFHTSSRPVLLYGVPDNFKVSENEQLPNPGPAKMVPLIPYNLQIVTNSMTPVSFSGDIHYRAVNARERYNGAKDLSVNYFARYNSKGLTLTFDVTDDKFVPVEKNKWYWDGDSIQLAFNVLRKDEPMTPDALFYTLSQTAAGPHVYARTTMTAAPQKTAATLKIQKLSETRLRYVFTVPWQELGADYPALKRGTPLGFTFLVNDNDGRGRKGYLHWADGIGAGRMTELFGWLLFR